MSKVAFFLGSSLQAVRLMQINRCTDLLAYIGFFSSLGMHPFATNVYQFQFGKKWRFIRMETPDISNNTGILSRHFYLRAQMNLEGSWYDVI